MGFRIGARQANTGAEQARLDGFAAAGVVVEVEVVALQLPYGTGPHIELLAYRRPAPFARATDDRGASTLADRLVWRGAGGTIELADPDGHRQRLVTPSRDPVAARIAALW